MIELHGHTDDLGNTDKNEALSWDRVKAVEKYIYSLGQGRVLRMAYGESKPLSDKRKYNRCVEIYYRTLNKDGTFDVFADNGAKVRANIYTFYGCGICTTNPRIESVKPMDKPESEGNTSIAFKVDCDRDTVKCKSLEFRFPYDYFNANEDIFVPRPIYVHGCGKRREDSTNVKEDSRFDIFYDSIAHEYVVTHECYSVGSTMCCGTMSFCETNRIHLPEAIEHKITTITRRMDTVVNDKLVYFDSTFVITDTNIFQLNRCEYLYDTIRGTGFLLGQLVFLEVPAFYLRKEKVRTEKGFYLRTDVFVDEAYYRPLEYKASKIMVKLPRKNVVTEVGYYLKEFDYFIPLSEMKRQRFLKEYLDYKFTFGFKDESGVVFLSLDPKDIKHRYKRRKNTYKFKVKRKQL